MDCSFFDRYILDTMLCYAYMRGEYNVKKICAVTSDDLLMWV